MPRSTPATPAARSSTSTASSSGSTPRSRRSERPTGGQSGNIGVGFSIPIDQVEHTVEQIIDTGHAEYPVIGAQVSLVRTLGGAEIETVTGSSPADQAGLQAAT